MSTEEQSIDETNNSESRAQNHEQEELDEDLRLLLLPDVSSLPQTPPSAVESNFVTYFALGISLLFLFLLLENFIPY